MIGEKIMEFKIGDRVKVKEYADIPEAHRTKAMGRMCGEVGIVTNKLYSEADDSYTYKIQFDNYPRPSTKMWTEEHLDLYEEPTTEYRYEFENLENMVVARLYEVTGDTKTEIARGHGHIIREGVIGIAQASSYALKKIYEKLNGGTLI